MKKGFTLIEVMVTTTILIIISTIILIDYSKFNRTLSLKTTAQEIAQNIRQAQVYGFGSKKLILQDVFPGYGIHFDKSIPNTYKLFADNPTNPAVSDDGNGKYDGLGGLDIDIKTFNIEKGNYIFLLCPNQQISTPLPCDSLNSALQIDVVYRRNRYTAIIKANGEDAELNDAKIVISSPKGGTKKIIIWPSGQIAVE